MFAQINKTTSVKLSSGDSYTLMRVGQVVQELADVRTYQVQIHDFSFRFTPGQYVTVNLPDFGVEGCLAISSSPYEIHSFSVTVKRQGRFGSTFYDNVLDGSALMVGTPTGLFCLAENGHRPVCYIGRDYSISSARSFARYLSLETDKRQFTLLHELSGLNRALFDREFEMDAYSWIRRSLYLDTDQTPNHWTANMGPITPFAVLNEVPDFLDTEFYISGEGKDVRRFRGVLRELNVPLQQIHVEKWS